MIKAKSFNLKLLHGFLGEVLSGSPIHAIIHRDPIDRNLGQQVLSPRDGNARIVVGEGAGICYRHDAYARLKTCEFKKVAPIEWQVLNLSRTYTALYDEFAGVDVGCLASYQHLFFDRTRPQLKI